MGRELFGPLIFSSLPQSFFFLFFCACSYLKGGENGTVIGSVRCLSICNIVVTSKLALTCRGVQIWRTLVITHYSSTTTGHLYAYKMLLIEIAAKEKYNFTTIIIVLTKTINKVKVISQERFALLSSLYYFNEIGNKQVVGRAGLSKGGGGDWIMGLRKVQKVLNLKLFFKKLQGMFNESTFCRRPIANLVHISRHIPLSIYSTLLLPLNKILYK